MHPAINVSRSSRPAHPRRLALRIPVVSSCASPSPRPAHPRRLALRRFPPPLLRGLNQQKGSALSPLRVAVAETSPKCQKLRRICDNDAFAEEKSRRVAETSPKCQKLRRICDSPASKEATARKKCISHEFRGNLSQLKSDKKKTSLQRRVFSQGCRTSRNKKSTKKTTRPRAPKSSQQTEIRQEKTSLQRRVLLQQTV